MDDIKKKYGISNDQICKIALEEIVSNSDL